MARKDQESMMQSKMAAAPNLPTTHLTKNWLLLKNQMKLMWPLTNPQESFVNDWYDKESDCSNWENENDIDFERSASDTFIIHAE